MPASVFLTFLCSWSDSFLIHQLRSAFRIIFFLQLFYSAFLAVDRGRVIEDIAEDYCKPCGFIYSVHLSVLTSFCSLLSGRQYGSMWAMLHLPVASLFLQWNSCSCLGVWEFHSYHLRKGLSLGFCLFILFYLMELNLLSSFRSWLPSLAASFWLSATSFFSDFLWESFLLLCTVNQEGRESILMPRCLFTFSGDANCLRSRERRVRLAFPVGHCHS